MNDRRCVHFGDESLKTMTIFLFSVFTVLFTGCLSAAIISQPGTQKAETMSNITFFWELDADFDTSSSWSWFEIYKGSTEGERLLEFQGSQSCKNYSTRIITCYVDGPRIGFSLYNIIDADAGRYAVRVDDNSLSPPPPVSDSDAILYIIKPPSLANITGNSRGFENETLILTCYAQSLSLPQELRNNSFLEYHWYGSYSGTGNTFTIGPLQKKDDGSNVTCRVKEQGASDKMYTESTKQLTVYYVPGRSTLQTNTTSAIEGREGIRLTCTLPDDQQGNPKEYFYYWKYPNRTKWTNSTDSSLTVDSDTLSAALHEGQWECKVGNVAGNGTTNHTHITVNALPSVLRNLNDTAILVNETLNISCVFKAKPVATVTWIYNMSEEPDTSVINISSNEQDDGPYTITTSTISWKTSNKNHRKTVSGFYSCKAESIIGEVMSRTMKLDVHYWPWTISFIGPGETSDKEEVIEDSKFVNRTCYADCNPVCTYTWTNNTENNEISHTSVLDLNKPDRYDAGSYTCNAQNEYGETSKNFTLDVKYTPSISITLSNTSDVIQSNNLTISCHVDSNPVSDIKLYNLTDNTTLGTVIGDNEAEYHFNNIHCLDTGEYLFTAKNKIPDESYAVREMAFIDVMCGPEQIYQIPENGVIGVPLGENYTLEIGIRANPYPEVTAQNWSFIDYNGTIHEVLPDNIATSAYRRAERLIAVATLTISHTESTNYGSYTLEVRNRIGEMSPVVLTVVPRGPPSAPSAPRLMDITAVSITINWTAGFNGELQQRFTVIYQAEGSNETHEDKVISHPDVNIGDLVVHKLEDGRSIKPNTTYNITIQAENDFKEDAIVYVKAVFTSDPKITLLDSTALIHFIISGPLTHIIEENCVMDTNICHKANITVPINKDIRLREQTDIHDFIAEVPLADVEADEFVFSFWMYDGQDLLDLEASVILAKKDGVNIGVIIGVVISIVLAGAVIVIFIIIWKRGIFIKKDSDKSRAVCIDPNRTGDDNLRIDKEAALNIDLSPGGLSLSQNTRRITSSTASVQNEDHQYENILKYENISKEFHRGDCSYEHLNCIQDPDDRQDAGNYEPLRGKTNPR